MGALGWNHMDSSPGSATCGLDEARDLLKPHLQRGIVVVPPSQDCYKD